MEIALRCPQQNLTIEARHTLSLQESKKKRERYAKTLFLPNNKQRKELFMTFSKNYKSSVVRKKTKESPRRSLENFTNRLFNHFGSLSIESRNPERHLKLLNGQKSLTENISSVTNHSEGNSEKLSKNMFWSVAQSTTGKAIKTVLKKVGQTNVPATATREQEQENQIESTTMEEQTNNNKLTSTSENRGSLSSRNPSAPGCNIWKMQMKGEIIDLTMEEPTSSCPCDASIIHSKVIFNPPAETKTALNVNQGLLTSTTLGEPNVLPMEPVITSVLTSPAHQLHIWKPIATINPELNVQTPMPNASYNFTQPHTADISYDSRNQPYAPHAFTRLTDVQAPQDLNNRNTNSFENVQNARSTTEAAHTLQDQYQEVPFDFQRGFYRERESYPVNNDHLNNPNHLQGTSQTTPSHPQPWQFAPVNVNEWLNLRFGRINSTHRDTAHRIARPQENFRPTQEGAISSQAWGAQRNQALARQVEFSYGQIIAHVQEREQAERDKFMKAHLAIVERTVQGMRHAYEPFDHNAMVDRREMIQTSQPEWEIRNSLPAEEDVPLPAVPRYGFYGNPFNSTNITEMGPNTARRHQVPQFISGRKRNSNPWSCNPQIASRQYSTPYYYNPCPPMPGLYYAPQEPVHPVPVQPMHSPQRRAADSGTQWNYISPDGSIQPYPAQHYYHPPQ